MKPHVKNKIDLDGQVELVERSRPVKLTEEDGYIYLTYINEEEGAVMLKCSKQELVMTRHSTPKSITRFHRENLTLVAIPTPVGLQHLRAQASVYELGAEQQHLKIHYQLRQVDGESVFANYQLKINRV